MPPDPPERRTDLANVLTAIRARAQATRRRVGRVDRLSRAHIAADLAQIEAQTDKLAALLFDPDGTGAAMAARGRADETGADRGDASGMDRIRQNADEGAPGRGRVPAGTASPARRSPPPPPGMIRGRARPRSGGASSC